MINIQTIKKIQSLGEIEQAWLKMKELETSFPKIFQEGAKAIRTRVVIIKKREMICETINLFLTFKDPRHAQLAGSKGILSKIHLTPQQQDAINVFNLEMESLNNQWRRLLETATKWGLTEREIGPNQPELFKKSSFMHD